MLEQKNPLIARKKSWGAHACVCTRRAGFRIARDQAAGPPPLFWWVAQRPPAPTGVLGSVEPSPSVHSGGESQ